MQAIEVVSDHFSCCLQAREGGAWRGDCLLREVQALHKLCPVRRGVLGAIRCEPQLRFEVND
jgi:hypothetical protein